MLGLMPLAPRISPDGDLAVIKPPAIPKNGTIQLITPASALKRSVFEQALSNMDLLGFKVKYSDNIKVSSGFLSGTDEQRLQDLHQAFADDSVDAVICARGGYGSARLLPHIDYNLIRSNPKVFVGYSDITALHAALFKKAGLITFHGPVGASELNDFSMDYLLDVTQNGERIHIKNNGQTPIKGGVCQGNLVGGNLSIINSLIGTPYEIKFDNNILFIEEIGEAAYRIDRMLTQLANSGALNKVKGIALGYFTGCDTDPSDPFYEYSVPLSEVFKDHFEPLNVPVTYGFPFGHEEHNATLPIGLRAELNADLGEIRLLESATA